MNLGGVLPKVVWKKMEQVPIAQQWELLGNRNYRCEGVEGELLCVRREGGSLRGRDYVMISFAS